MPFSSLLFLCGFLPAFLLLYWTSPAKLKNAVALGFSLLFYAWGAPGFLPVVLALGVLDYVLGHAIHRSGDSRRKAALLAVGVVTHLSTLCYFKYSNFFVAQINETLRLMGWAPPLPWTAVILPIGISFLTFEEISCLVDIYRGDAKPARSLLHYLLFLMLFPHSIAGPIFRWKDLEAQLQERPHSWDNVLSGFTRFSQGLAKKVLIANPVALTADSVFSLHADQLTPLAAWLGAIAYGLQIYFDFSGYSDMAIGLGRMAGFSFKENFNHPYISSSITEFWRRWHISLSTWMRDYLYIPLGGGRATPFRVNLNVMTVFLLSGFWHGASWTFLLWGGYHGAFVLLERVDLVDAFKRRLPRAVNVLMTLIIVLVGWVFFRAESAGFAFRFIAAMAGFADGQGALPLLPGQMLPYRTVAAAGVGVGLAILPLLRARAPAPPRLAGVVWSQVCLLLSMAYLVNSRFNPLIYFKF